MKELLTVKANVYRIMGLSVIVPEICFDCLLFAVNRSLD